ncbi:MAG TPA: hypothetical protein VJG30_02930 [Candidatus Nanoarchaeia archaeon]|nr:hypothetical protein [Candidatus Nanoarchaeia archaeon]
MAKQNIPSKSLSVITGLALGSTIYVLATSTRADDSGVIGPVPAEDTDLTEDRMALEALDITGEKKSADAGVQDAGDVSAVPIPATETPDGGPAAPEDKKTHDDLSLFGIEKRGLAHKPTESIQQGKGWQGAARLFADYRILENLLTGVRQEGPSLNGEAGLGRDWGLGGAGLRLGYGQSRVTVEKARAELGESTQHTLYFGPMGYLEIAHGKDLETQLYAALQGLLKETKSKKTGLRPRTTEISNDGLEAELSVALPKAFSLIPRRLERNKDTDLGIVAEVYLVFTRETMDDRTDVDYGKQWEGMLNLLLTGNYKVISLGAGAEFTRRYTLQLTPDGIPQETVDSWNNSGRVGVRGNRGPHYNAISPLARLELNLGNTWNGGLRGVYGFDGDLKRRQLDIYFENPNWEFAVGYDQTHATGDFKETGLVQGSIQYRGDSSKVLKSVMRPVRRIFRKQHR